MPHNPWSRALIREVDAVALYLGLDLRTTPAERRVALLAHELGEGIEPGSYLDLVREDSNTSLAAYYRALGPADEVREFAAEELGHASGPVRKLRDALIERIRRW